MHPTMKPLRQRLSRAISLLGLLALFGCATPYPGCAALPGGGHYCLQATRLVAPFEVEQKVEASLRGQRETLIASIAVDAQRLSFVGLTPFGHKLLHLVYDNQAASAPTLPDQRLNPTLLIALLQLAQWPSEAVRDGLSADLALQERDGERTILSNGRLIIAIRPPGPPRPEQVMQIAIPAIGLELAVQTLVPMPSPETRP